MPRNTMSASPKSAIERLHSIFATLWRNAISAFPEFAAMLNFLLADSAADKRYHPAACRSALPANVRLCIAKVVLSPPDARIAVQEQGASAPRGNPRRVSNHWGPRKAGVGTGVGPSRRRYTQMQWRSAHAPSAVRRTSALVSAQACFHTHGGLTPAAPGWMYVCASQKSFFRRRTSVHQHESGGR
jgi:hypothetical protein